MRGSNLKSVAFMLKMVIEHILYYSYFRRNCAYFARIFRVMKLTSNHLSSRAIPHKKAYYLYNTTNVVL